MPTVRHQAISPDAYTSALVGFSKNILKYGIIGGPVE